MEAAKTMNSKRREVIERAARTMLPRIAEVIPSAMHMHGGGAKKKDVSGLKLEFYEEDSTILSRLDSKAQVLHINCKALGDAAQRAGFDTRMEREHEAILGWLLGREMFFFLRDEDHTTDTRNLTGTAEAFKKGYDQAKADSQ